MVFSSLKKISKLSMDKFKKLVIMQARRKNGTKQSGRLLTSSERLSLTTGRKR